MKQRQFTKTTLLAATPEALTQRAVSTLVRTTTGTGLLCTVTTAEAHQYATGDFVLHSGADQTEYNRLFQVTVVDTTTYTFVLADTPATLSTKPTAVATGTIVAVGRIQAIKAVIQPGKGAAGRTANAGTVYVGVVATNDTQPSALASATDQLVLEPGPGKYFNLGDYFLDVVTAADGVLVQFWPRI